MDGPATIRTGDFIRPFTVLLPLALLASTAGCSAAPTAEDVGPVVTVGPTETSNDTSIVETSTTDVSVSTTEAPPQFDFPAFMRDAPFNGSLDVMAACFDTADESRFGGLFADETTLAPGIVQADDSQGTFLTSTFVDVVAATPDDATLAFFCNYTHRFEESHVQLVRYTRDGAVAVAAEAIDVSVTAAPVPWWIFGGPDAASEPLCRTTSVDAATLADNVIEITHANTCAGMSTPDPANRVRTTWFTLADGLLAVTPFQTSVIHDHGVGGVDTLIAAATILETVLDQPQVVYGDVPFEDVLLGLDGGFEVYLVNESIVVALVGWELDDEYDLVRYFVSAVMISPSGEVAPGPAQLPPTPYFALLVEEIPGGVHPYLWTLESPHNK